MRFLWKTIGCLGLLCCLFFACVESQWNGIAKKCKPIQQTALKKTQRWKETFGKEGEAVGCLQVSWGTNEGESIGIYAALGTDGLLTGYSQLKEDFSSSIQLSFPRTAEGKQKRFEVFFFGSSIPKNKQQGYCETTMSKPSFVCERKATGTCWFSLSFEPVSSASLLSKPVPNGCVYHFPDTLLPKEPVGEPIPDAAPTEPKPESLPEPKPEKENPYKNLEVLIPAGYFTMGSPVTEIEHKDDEVLHKVRLTRPFYMWKYEVTQKLFGDVSKSNPSRFRNCPNCPVEYVSWHQSAAFCNYASINAGLPLCYDCTGVGSQVSCQAKKEFTGSNYTKCKGYRLPTESEWEYAFRAGTSTAFYNGPIKFARQLDPNLDKIAWFWDNAGRKTHPVGQKDPNQFGLYDMAGNVVEWVYDWYAPYPKEALTVDPSGPLTGKARCFRGGFWRALAYGCRAGTRTSSTPTRRDIVLGFRPVRTR